MTEYLTDLLNRIKGSSVFITGATGFIGSSIVRTLLEYNELKGTEPIKVFAQIRNTEKARELFGSGQVNYVPGDIRAKIEPAEQIDYIIHCAGITASAYMIRKPEETRSIIVEGTENVLEFAKRTAAKGMVFLSSMEVYGRTTKSEDPVSENDLGYLDPDDPRSCYPLGKREAEKLCVAAAGSGVPVKIVRLAQTMGAGVLPDDNRMPVQFARSIVSGNDIVLHTEGRSLINYCYIDDAITGIFKVLADGAAGEAYNVVNDAETRSVREIAELVAGDVSRETFGRTVDVIYDIPETNTYGYAADSIMRLSSAKLRALGWEPAVEMKEGYKRLAGYIKALK